MSFISSLTARLPFAKKQEASEVFFALNIGLEKMTAALWSVESGKMKILDTQSDVFSGSEDVIKVADRLLDAVVGEKEIDPQKILFGVPDSWLLDENLKEEYLKLLRKLVKELELSPMAYVSQTTALVHLLEKQEGVPTTAILAGLEEKHVVVTVTRAGKLDGTKVVLRSDDLGVDIEKALLNFTSVEVLPSKILIYGLDEAALEKTKSQLLSFAWMSKLSFLHFPKIEALSFDSAIVGVCFAGASEIDENVTYSEDKSKAKSRHTSDLIMAEEPEKEEVGEKGNNTVLDQEDLGFVVGDVAAKAPEGKDEEETKQPEESNLEEVYPSEEEELAEEPEQTALPQKSQRKIIPASLNLSFIKNFNFKKFTGMPVLVVIGVVVTLAAAYLFLLKADVKVFVEPKILENDTQVIADPAVKTVNEDQKTIPGQIVETDVSGSGKGSATGKKQVGDPAKGTVVIYNKTSDSQSLPKGTTLSSSNGLKFTLDVSVTIASQSASDTGITYGKETKPVTASAIGPDSNLPSGSDLTVSGYSASQVAAKAEGNFSGGTSKDVTVVSDADQQKLLAQVASDLRNQAQQKLQGSMPDKKVLAEALSETITKKSFSKSINDQASDFTLNLTAHYKGTAYDDKDLRTIVSKLVSTNIPSDFNLDLGSSETQADVSKVDKSGKVIFLARFKAKLIPKVDVDQIKRQIAGKSADGAVDIVKSINNVLGAEIKLTPALPGFLRRLPFLQNNIHVEVGLK